VTGDDRLNSCIGIYGVKPADGDGEEYEDEGGGRACGWRVMGSD